MSSGSENSRPILSWNTVILLALGTAHLLFSQVTSALLVVAMAIFVGLDLVSPKMPDEMESPRRHHRFIFILRIALLFFVTATAVLLPTALNIESRLAEGPATHATDGLIQTEVAIEFLVEGKNPYVEDYADTILADWKGGEPPWTPVLGPFFHFAYLPLLFLGSAPFYLLSQSLLGWYDQRLLYTALFLLTLLLLPLLVKRQRSQLTLISLVGLNFLHIFFLAEGRNDTTILFGLVLTTVMLARGRLKLSALVLGLTLMTKHQAWFFLPFYLLFSFPRNNKPTAIPRWLLSLWPLYTTVGLIMAPFLLSDASAFVEDTIGYIMGASEHSFPIRGIGFSHLLVAVGLVPSYEASFPFWIFSLLFGIPVLVYALRRQSRVNTVANMWLAFVLFAFIVQFFSRFFNDNYLVFLLDGLFIAAFIEPVGLGATRAERVVA